MKHFLCDFRVQHLRLHKNGHISFLLVAKSEILYNSVIFQYQNWWSSKQEHTNFPKTLDLSQNFGRQKGTVKQFPNTEPTIMG